MTGTASGRTHPRVPEPTVAAEPAQQPFEHLRTDRCSPTHRHPKGCVETGRPNSSMTWLWVMLRFFMTRPSTCFSPALRLRRCVGKSSSATRCCIGGVFAEKVSDGMERPDSDGPDKASEALEGLVECEISSVATQAAGRSSKPPVPLISAPLALIGSCPLESPRSADCSTV